MLMILMLLREEPRNVARQARHSRSGLYTYANFLGYDLYSRAL